MRQARPLPGSARQARSGGGRRAALHRTHRAAPAGRRGGEKPLPGPAGAERPRGAVQAPPPQAAARAGAARPQATPAATHQALAVGGEPAEQPGELERLREVHGGAGAGREQRGAAAPQFEGARSAPPRPRPRSRRAEGAGAARPGGQWALGGAAAPRCMPGAGEGGGGARGPGGGKRAGRRRWRRQVIKMQMRRLMSRGAAGPLLPPLLPVQPPRRRRARRLGACPRAAPRGRLGSGGRRAVPPGRGQRAAR